MFPNERPSVLQMIFNMRQIPFHHHLVSPQESVPDCGIVAGAMGTERPTAH